MNVEQKYLNLVRNAVLDAVSDRACSVYFFGSRQSGNAVRSSDYDIAFSGMSGEQFAEICVQLTKWWEDSVVPHKLDLINLDQTDASFRNAVFAEGEVWKTV